MNSKYWTAVFSAKDGQRLDRSTKQTDRKKAQTIADAWEDAERRAKHGTITENKIREILSDTLEKATGDRLNTYTTREWLTQWLEGKAGSVSASSLLKYKQVIRDFLAHLGVMANLTIEAITSKEIVDFRTSFLDEGRTPQTANSAISKTLNIPFAAALRSGVIKINPVANVPKLREQKNERDIFTPEELTRLIAAADGEWQGLIRVAYYTGARLNDAVSLRWENIDLEKKTIHFTPGKTAHFGKKLTLVMHSGLFDWLLKQQAPDEGGKPLFPELCQRSISGRSGLSEHFFKIMAKAGVGYEELRSSQGKGRAFKSRSFHSLRHSFNSALANAGVPVEIRQQFTGHASAEMNATYTHLELQTMRNAVENLPTI